MSGIREYFGNISDALSSTVKGMGITMQHFVKERPITVQFPHERLPLPPSYKGIHILEQDKCIDCKLCAKACPVDCIEIEAVHHGRVLEWQKFSIDYKKCIFCEFCIPPCPKDCIHMTSEYEVATDDPTTMIEDLLTWTGLRAEDRRAIEAAEAKRAGKAVEEPKNGGPAPGNPAPSGTEFATKHPAGSWGAPGGAPAKAEGAAAAAGTAKAAAPAAAGGADSLAAKTAAIRAKLAAAKGAG
jgi:NADH-quinone oxidoreductase chain I